MLLFADPAGYLMIPRALVESWPGGQAERGPLGEPVAHWASSQISAEQRRKRRQHRPGMLRAAERLPTAGRALRRGSVDQPDLFPASYADEAGSIPAAPAKRPGAWGSTGLVGWSAGGEGRNAPRPHANPTTGGAQTSPVARRGRAGPGRGLP